MTQSAPVAPLLSGNRPLEACQQAAADASAERAHTLGRRRRAWAIIASLVSGARGHDMLRQVLSGRGTVPAAGPHPASDPVFNADRAAAEA
jgi:hypothetical protein